jgi:hypothetical protein
MSSAPRDVYVFTPDNRMAGVAVPTADGRWRATKGGRTFGTFETIEGARAVLIDAAEQEGHR